MLYRNALLMCLLAVCTNSLAALTSAPIYAPCAAGFERSDISTCRRPSGSATYTPMTYLTCYPINISAKARSITLALEMSVIGNGAVATHIVTVYNTDSPGCPGNTIVARYGVREFVAANGILIGTNETEYVLPIPSAATGTVYLQYGNCSNCPVSYYVTSYTDR